MSAPGASAPGCVARGGFGANITSLYTFSFLKMTLFPMAVITLFWKDHIGLSLTQILCLQSILSVVMVLMEYPTGYISDRIGYRQALSLASLLGIAGWSVYTVSGTFTQVLCAEVLLGVSLAFISGSDSALLYESLAAGGREHDYARCQGRMSAWAQAGESLGALCAGVIYAASPLLPFALQVAVWLMALLAARSMREPPRHVPQAESHLAEALHSFRLTFSGNPRLRSITLFSAILGLASFYPVWLIQPHMRQAGVPLAWFGPVWAGANVCVVLGALLSHRIATRAGERSVAVVMVLLVLAGYLGLGLQAGLWGFLFYYALTVMRGIKGPMMLGLTHRESPSSRRAGIVSLQSFCFRLMFAASGPLIGMLADALGTGRAFLVLFWLFALALPPLALLFRRHGGRTVTRMPEDLRQGS